MASLVSLTPKSRPNFRSSNGPKLTENFIPFPNNLPRIKQRRDVEIDDVHLQLQPVRLTDNGFYDGVLIPIMPW